MLKVGGLTIAVCYLSLCCHFGSNSALLHAQVTGTIHKPVPPASAQREILNPDTVPSWLQTGKFRAARWDGGPIEARSTLTSI